MSDIYFTITGMSHYYGTDFLKRNMYVTLIKDKENEFDKEAIKVEIKGLGKIGYVANSPHTVLGESFSAGRIYDKIKDMGYGKILYIFHSAAVGILNKNSIKDMKNR